MDTAPPSGRRLAVKEEMEKAEVRRVQPYFVRAYQERPPRHLPLIDAAFVLAAYGRQPRRLLPGFVQNEGIL